MNDVLQSKGSYKTFSIVEVNNLMLLTYDPKLSGQNVIDYLIVSNSALLHLLLFSSILTIN